MYASLSNPMTHSINREKKGTERHQEMLYNAGGCTKYKCELVPMNLSTACSLCRPDKLIKDNWRKIYISTKYERWEFHNVEFIWRRKVCNDDGEKKGKPRDVDCALMLRRSLTCNLEIAFSSNKQRMYHHDKWENYISELNQTEQAYTNSDLQTFSTIP